MTSLISAIAVKSNFYTNCKLTELTAGSEQYQNYKFPVTSESVTDSVEEICHLWNGRLYINTEEWQTHVGVDCTSLLLFLFDKISKYLHKVLKIIICKLIFKNLHTDYLKQLKITLQLMCISI